MLQIFMLARGHSRPIIIMVTSLILYIGIEYILTKTARFGGFTVSNSLPIGMLHSLYMSSLDIWLSRLKSYIDPVFFAENYLLAYAFISISGLVFFIIAAVTLYIWIISRQVRPRQISKRAAGPKFPDSPTARRCKTSRSHSFSNLQDLTHILQPQGVSEIPAAEEFLVFPLSLRLKFNAKELNWIYDALSRVFTYLRGNILCEATKSVQLRHFKRKECIFSRGDHDGSILIVFSGRVSLQLYHDAHQVHLRSPAMKDTGETASKDPLVFSKEIYSGEVVCSSISLLSVLTDDLAYECHGSVLKNKTCGNMSAIALCDGTSVLEIPWRSVRNVADEYPDCLFRLAQAVFDQLEKITVRTLIDHFGMYTRLYVPHPLISTAPGDAMAVNASTDQGDWYKSCIHKIVEALGVSSDLKDTFAENSTIKGLIPGMILDDFEVLEAGVYFVVDGEVNVHICEGSCANFAYTAGTGCQIGLVSCFIGYRTTSISLRCTDTNATLIWTPITYLSNLIHDTKTVTCCASHLLHYYTDLVCTLDNSFEWHHLQGGEILFKQGDYCNAVYKVLNGRLQVIEEYKQRDRTLKSASDLLRGATIGALDMLAATQSTSTVHVIRDSQISKMPKNIFDYVVMLDPTVLLHFTKTVARQIPHHCAEHQVDVHANQDQPNNLLSLGTAAASHEAPDHTLPLSTIAVLSITAKCRIAQFCDILLESLQSITATVKAISSKESKDALGYDWDFTSRMARSNLSTWLGDIENANDLVLYVADSNLTAWTKLCIRQADHILLLSSDTETQQSFLEEMADILNSAWTRRNVAISVVKIRGDSWTVSFNGNSQQRITGLGTSTAFKRRLRALRGESLILPKFLLPMEKYEWISYYHNVQQPFDKHRNDFDRLARRLTGNAIGLVLGGGGARGLAHIGILRALNDSGVCVDVVGGTSIGAFIGALYSLHPYDFNCLEKKIKMMSSSLSSAFEKVFDLTLPISSFFNGNRFNKAIRMHFDDLNIEDLMLNYFCVTTDIAKSRMSIHRCGSVWKYVRASMSLQGYLPPVSENGSLLLDGGYMNNLPADIMHEEGGVKYILAVDVGRQQRNDYYGYGSSLSGWWILWNKLNPFSKTVMVPSMGDISAALAYVASDQNKERIRDEYIDLYLRPPVQDYGTLQFDKMEEIIKVGYDYALPRIQEWKKWKAQINQRRLYSHTNCKHDTKPTNHTPDRHLVSNSAIEPLPTTRCKSVSAGLQLNHLS